MPPKSRQQAAKRQVKFDTPAELPAKRSASPPIAEAPKRAKADPRGVGTHGRAPGTTQRDGLDHPTAPVRSRVSRGSTKPTRSAEVVEPGYVVVGTRSSVSVRGGSSAHGTVARTSDSPTLDSADEDGADTEPETGNFLDIEAEEDNSPEDASAPSSEDSGEPRAPDLAAPDVEGDGKSVLDPAILSLLGDLADDPAFKDRFQSGVLAKLKKIATPRNGDRADEQTDRQPAVRREVHVRPREPEQARLPSTFAPDDEKHNGVNSCLDASIWAPALKKMYRTLVPPPRIVAYKGRMTGAHLTPPDFQPWVSQADQLGFMLQVLSFSSNAHYVNLSRARWSDFEVVDTQSAGRPLRFLARKRSKAPVLCMSLVQVVKSTLLRSAQVPRKNGEGWLDKKTLVANLFAQELELMICTLGCAYGANLIILPSWTSNDATRGLTFQTRLSASTTGPAPGARRRGLYAPDDTPTNAVSGQVPMQLSAAHTIPVIDSTVDGFDISAPFADVVRRPAMQDEPPPGSLGAVFYTITDQGSEHTIDFNIQAFAWVAHDENTPLGPQRADDDHGLDDV